MTGVQTCALPNFHHSEDFENLELGIKKNQEDESHELKALYLNPFFEIKNYCVKYFNFMKKKYLNLYTRSFSNEKKYN